MRDLFIILLAGSALAFLGTAGFLIANGGAVAALFAKRRSEAEAGEMVVDPHDRHPGERRGAVKFALALHGLALIGMIGTTVVMSGVMQHNRPAGDGVPPEMDPLPRPG